MENAILIKNPQEYRVSAAVKMAASPNHDSVRALFSDLNSNLIQQFDIRDDHAAKGVPMPTVNMLAELRKSGSADDFHAQCVKAITIATSKYSDKAPTLGKLQDDVTKLVELEADAVYSRNIARDMGLNPQAFNMLCHITRQNSGDGGQKVLNDIVQYAQTCGIEIVGIPVLEGSKEQSGSILPEIIITENQGNGFLRYRNLIIELVLATVVTYTSLLLLT